MTRFAIFKHDKQVTLDYADKVAALYIARVMGFVVHATSDFGNVSRNVLADGYEVKEVGDD